MSDEIVDHEARAVTHMSKEIRDEEDDRVRAVLDKLLVRNPESFAAQMARMGEQPITVGSMLMSEASYQDVVNMNIANGVADEERAKMDNPHSMGAMVHDAPCPECEPLTDEQREALIRLGRQSGKTERVTEYMQEHSEAVLQVGHREGMSLSTAAAVAFHANYGPKLDLKALRAAAEALHNASVPLEEAKQRMMDAMDKLTPAEIPLVQRELQKMLVKHGPARPVNRAQRRQAQKARRRA
jgi:hypothetical protein